MRSKIFRVPLPEFEESSFLDFDPQVDFEKYSLQEEVRKERAAILLARMRLVDISNIREALNAYETDWVLYDRFYRVHYLSFKMYHLNNDVLRYCKLLFDCVDEELPIDEPSHRTFIGTLHGEEDPEAIRTRNETYSTVVKRFEQVGLNPLFRQLVSDSLSCYFHSNERDIWYEHQMKMTSAWIHAGQACWATVEEISAARKEDRLPGVPDGENTNEHQSLFQQVWNLGVLRHFDDAEEIKSRVEALG